jgi:hypothetical protein
VGGGGVYLEEEAPQGAVAQGAALRLVVEGRQEGVLRAYRRHLLPPARCIYI